MVTKPSKGCQGLPDLCAQQALLPRNSEMLQVVGECCHPRSHARQEDSWVCE